MTPIKSDERYLKYGIQCSLQILSAENWQLTIENVSTEINFL